MKRLEFLDGGMSAFIGFDDRFVGTRISALGRKQTERHDSNRPEAAEGTNGMSFSSADGRSSVDACKGVRLHVIQPSANVRADPYDGLVA